MQGNLLFIDLEKKTYRVERDESLFQSFLGGTAAATELLWRHCDPSCDPLGAENRIIFAIGPFNGIFPVATKTIAMFKSPLTGELGESHAGGRLAMALREADIDVLVIHGKAEYPTFISIKNHNVTFHSARTVWGKSALASERILREFEPSEGRKSSIVRIGPAGERLSPIACATVDSSRHFGRLGLGAVMGSKNLKAIIISGTHGPSIEHHQAYKAVYDLIHDKVVNSNEMRKYHDLGTPSNILPLNGIRGLPTRNFSQGFFEGAQNISGEAMARNHLVQHSACAHCPCGCIHMAELKEEFKPFHYRTTRVSYDYELLFSLGTQLSLSSPNDVLRLIAAVEKEGWDAMSMGDTLAWASEAFLSGVVGLDITEGLPIQFGDADGYMDVLNKIKEGKTEFFRDIEQGTNFCANKYGGRDFAMTFGKVEPAGYLTGENAIITWIMGIRHSHLDDFGYSLDQKLLTKPSTLEEQVTSQVTDAQWRMVTNSLAVCLFGRNIYDDKIIQMGLEAIGHPWEEKALKKLGEDTLRRKHFWRSAAGFSLKEISIPEKLFRIQTSNGSIDRDRMMKRVELYASIAGFTS